MPRFRLHVISEPGEDDPRPVFVRTGAAALSQKAGEERMALVCGQCETVLITNVVADLLANVVLKCPNCGSYNEAEHHQH